MYKNVTYILSSVVLGLLLLYGAYTLGLKENANHELIQYKIEEIIEEIEGVEYDSESEDPYAHIVTLVNIRQDCKTVLDLIGCKDPTNEVIAVGDFIGFIYIRINIVDKYHFKDESVNAVLEELENIRSILFGITGQNYKHPNDFYITILRNIEAKSDKYPDNDIIQNFNNRTIPDSYLPDID